MDPSKQQSRDAYETGLRRWAEARGYAVPALPGDRVREETVTPEQLDHEVRLRAFANRHGFAVPETPNAERVREALQARAERVIGAVQEATDRFVADLTKRVSEHGTCATDGDQQTARVRDVCGGVIGAA